MKADIQVSADKQTVWVNDESSCIGRFSKKFGIDVHNSLTELLSGEPHCLYCTHEPANEEAWFAFCAAMLEYHQVKVRTSLLTFP